jgi:hypothetical protein
MVTISPFVGAEYWQTQFGLNNFPEFEAAVGPLVPNFPIPSWLGGNIADSVLLRNIYNDPASPQGVYVSVRLAGRGLQVPEVQTEAMAKKIPQAQPNYPENIMSTLIIPNAFQVSIQMTSGGQVVENVIGVTNAGGTASGAASAVRAAWEGTTGPLKRLSSLIVMTNYHAVDLSSAFGTIFDLSSSAVGGVSTTNSLATMGACALVSWNGSQRSRSTRGRLYFGPILESNINADGRTLGPGDRSNITNAFTQFRSDLASAGYPLAVLSRTLSQAFPVSSNATELVIATQRRRIR